MNDWNPKKTSLRFHLPPSASIEPMPGSSMSPSALPSRSKSLSCGAGVFLVLRDDLSVHDSGALQNAVRRGNDFLPVGAGGIGRVHHEQAEVRRVFVGGDVKLALENLAGVLEILAAGEFDRRRAGFQVLQIKLVLARGAFVRSQQQPAIIVVGQLRDQYLFLLAALAPDQRIFFGSDPRA